MSGRVRLEAEVHGRVQGVGFRWFVQRRADALGLDGWVANGADGSVRVVAEGLPVDIDHLLAALREGPSSAHVERVDARRGPALGNLDGFRIRAAAHRGD